MRSWKQLSPSVLHDLGYCAAYGLTDTGTVRENNQDNFLIDPELGLSMVADGMGGHDDGDIASADALTLMQGYLHASFERANGWRGALEPNAAASADPAPQLLTTLHDALAYVNERMYLTNRAHSRGSGSGMGTTLTGLWQPEPGGPLLSFHVGDSRLYRYRQGELAQLTHDQTLYQQALDNGARPPLPPRNLLLQALGPSSAVTPEVHSHDAVAGDVYLLCSDGLYGESPDAQIAAVLSVATKEHLPACGAALVAMAKHDGSRDNITVLLLSYAAEATH